MNNILQINNISKYYGNKSSLTKAIDNISLSVDKGELIKVNLLPLWVQVVQEKLLY